MSYALVESFLKSCNTKTKICFNTYVSATFNFLLTKILILFNELVLGRWSLRKKGL